MQFSFFEKQVDRLRATYSPGSLNEERKRLLWERFRNVPDHVFESALSHLISEYTSQALPAISRFAEAVGVFRANTNLHLVDPSAERPSGFSCEACRDFGYGFVGDTVTQCVCDSGRKLNPSEIARQQANYDRGRKMFSSTKAFKLFTKDLPYDPKQRGEIPPMPEGAA